jgi:hypothetical protein
MRTLTLRSSLATLLLALFVSGPTLAANIELINIDPAGVGFNDPTPATPVGGNPGTTIGEQRLAAYQRALDLWGSVLKSKVTIYVVGSFSSFPPELCAGQVLARAGALQIFSDFPNAPKKKTWYAVALANSLAGEDLAPGQLGPEDGYAGADILAQFNGGIGTPNCIPGSTWYYGLDNHPPAGQIDFLNTFMHEVAHGLGFANFITETDGLPPAYPDFDYPDIYMRNTLDDELHKTWDKLTPEQIVASASNTGHVVWSGKQVTKSAPDFLGPWTGLRITAPSTIARDLETGNASFGPAATPDNFAGEVVLGVSTTDPTNTLGCGPISPVVAGKIALVDRGSCAFLVKAQNAQAAGAVALLVANNAPGTAGMSGTDPNVTIPALMVSQDDGALIKANLPGVEVAIIVDPTRLAGANDRHQVKLYAPAVIALGSSISHFDTSAEPNLLMEPAITSSLRAGTNVDLTAQLFKDIGWPIESLKLGSCDTRVPNVTPVGDIISTQVEQCAADSSNRAEFVGCVAHIAVGLLSQRYINFADAARMVVCSATVPNP